MAIATRPKPNTYHKKRVAQHHRQTKRYLKAYLPYIPLLAIIGFGCMLNSVRPASHVLGASSGLSPSSLLTQTNIDRLANHQASLALNTQLDSAAQAKATDMVTRDYWSHDTPDGATPWSFITSAGYAYQSAGENLAYGFSNAASVLSGWMHSPEHRANVLGVQYQAVGFGIAESPNYNHSGPETVIVALYASPLSTTGPGIVLADSTSSPVSRLALASSSSYAAELFIGIVASLAIIVVLFRHSIAWHKLVVRGEGFVLKHQWFDIGLVGIATLGVLLDRTVGFIH